MEKHFVNWLYCIITHLLNTDFPYLQTDSLSLHLSITPYPSSATRAQSPTAFVPNFSPFAGILISSFLENITCHLSKLRFFTEHMAASPHLRGETRDTNTFHRPGAFAVFGHLHIGSETHFFGGSFGDLNRQGPCFERLGAAETASSQRLAQQLLFVQSYLHLSSVNLYPHR